MILKQMNEIILEASFKAADAWWDQTQKNAKCITRFFTDDTPNDIYHVGFHQHYFFPSYIHIAWTICLMFCCCNKNSKRKNNAPEYADANPNVNRNRNTQNQIQMTLYNCRFVVDCHAHAHATVHTFSQCINTRFYWKCMRHKWAYVWCVPFFDTSSLFILLNGSLLIFSDVLFLRSNFIEWKFHRRIEYYEAFFPPNSNQLSPRSNNLNANVGTKRTHFPTKMNNEYKPKWKWVNNLLYSTTARAR